MSGIVGLAVMGFMFVLKPDMSFNGVSIWIIYLITWIAYLILMFIMSRGGSR